MTPKLELLLVEDSEDDAALLERELRRAGYDLRVHRVWTPEDLKAALHSSWDLVISDWHMPRLDGLRAFELVRERDPDLPFIIVSGTIGEEIAVDALKAGVQDFMSKGKLSRLVPAIERVRSDAAIRRRQRAADAELARHRRELEGSERLLRGVLDSVPDAVIVTDHEGRLTTWNAAAGALFAFDAEHVNNLVAEHIELVLPDRITRVPDAERPLVQALQGAHVDRREVFVRGRADAALTWVSVSVRLLRDDSGVTGAVLVFRDMSRERAAQEQLMISDRMASVGMLAAGVAHEINNPLAAVLANVDMAASTAADAVPLEGVPRQELIEMLEDARHATDRVRQIVRDLRIFSRHEEESSGAVDLRSLLASTIRMAWNEIRHRARLVVDYAELPPVRGSESRLGQVFLNLIVNAAQAITEGNAEHNKIRVATSRTANSRALVEVSDTGSGISQDALGNLFTPFYTTKPQGVGTGLGLTISHRIVTGIGGSIEVESELGRGTTFRVILPFARHTPSIAPPVRAIAPPARRGRILIIDDEPIVAAAMRRMLAGEHEVEVSTRAAEALERARAGEVFDVMLCDLMMPQMTGMELHAAMQAIDAAAAERIVFMTGGAFTVAARRFLDQVPNRRIEKPFSAPEVRALINELVT